MPTAFGELGNGISYHQVVHGNAVMATNTKPVNESSRGAWLRQGAAYAALVLVIALAALMRFSPYNEAISGDLILSFGNDSPYHVRRILRLIQDARYPGLFDPLLDWPRGAETHWSPGFDSLGALITTALGGRHDAHRAALIIASLPVVYGLIATFVIAWLARRLVPAAGWGVGATAALFAALLPQFVTISQIGFVDHHVTEVLFTALLWRWTVWRAELAEARAPARQRAWFEVTGALLVALTAWVQSVGLLYVGVAAAALMVASFTTPLEHVTDDRPWLGNGTSAFGAGAALLALLFAPAVREHGHTVAYEWPSYFQPALFVLAAIAIAASAALARRLTTLKPRTIALSIGTTMAALTGGVILIIVLVPEARAATQGLFDFVTTSGTDISAIAELRPLFAAPLSPDGSRWDKVDGFFGWIRHALPVLLPLGLLAVRRAGRERFAGALVWTVALLGMTLAQNRWSRPFTVHIAVLSALGLWFLARETARRLAPRLLPDVAAATAFVVAAALLVVPEPARALAPPPARDGSSVLEAGLFLRNTGRSPEVGRQSGVIAPWSMSFELLQLSGLPILATGHAWIVGEDGYRRERAAWTSDSAALWSLMEERDLRFVVAGAGSLTRVSLASGPVFLTDATNKGRINWSYFKELPLGNLVLGGTALPDLDVHHIEYLCPRFVTSEFAPLEVPLPRLWVYERVRGALLKGHAAPGSRVLARLHLRHAAGIVPYDAYAQADANGFFTLRFPIPTQMKQSTLLSAGSLRIERAGVSSIEIEVPEQAVQAGGDIAVPDAF